MVLPFPYLAGILGAAFALCYATVVVSLLALWATYPLYSHGYVVPLIAGWLCWTKYQANPSIESKPDYLLGVPVLLAGVGLMIVGHVAAILTVKQVSLIVALTGFVLVLFGRKTLVRYRFPLAYLLFMVPVWDVGLNQLQDPSRLISARIASVFLYIANVPVLREGTTLVLSSVTLSVLRQCSGVNQLVALIAMVVPASYVFLDSNKRRVLLLAFSVAVVYLSNGFRIALVGWLAVNGFGDGDLAASYTHVLEGLVVSAVGYAVILVALSWLSRFNRTAGDPTSDRTSAPLNSSSSHSPRRPLVDLAVVGGLLIAAPIPIIARPTDVSPSGEFRTLPETLGSWRLAERDGVTASRLSRVSETLVDAHPGAAGLGGFRDVDDEVSLVYENSSARVRLYIGYYRRQEEGRELAGEAGQLLARASTPVSLIVGSDTVTAREVIPSDHPATQGMLYWYDINGRIVSDRYLVKAYTAWNALTRQRTNGAVVMITWETRPGATANGTTEALAFASELVPVLRTHVTD